MVTVASEVVRTQCFPEKWKSRQHEFGQKNNGVSQEVINALLSSVRVSDMQQIGSPCIGNIRGKKSTTSLRKVINTLQSDQDHCVCLNVLGASVPWYVKY